MEHSYNKDMVEEIKGFTPDGKMMGIQRIDKNGKVIFIERYDADGKVIAKQRFDDYGNLNSKVKYQADGTEIVEMVDLFEYDATGNWINRVNFMRGNPIMIIGREIEYYE
jgi:antitoxin component YwqK of YwqJK toxin-antitoxin module